MGLGREGCHGSSESAVPDLHATPESSRAFLTEPSMGQVLWVQTSTQQEGCLQDKTGI